MPKTIEAVIYRRYYSHKRHSELLGIEPPKREDFEKIVCECFNKGARCYYCGQELEVHSPHPYRNAISIDHKLPLTSGGTNDINNLVVCCHQCNIIKSTMSHDTYMALLDLLRQDEQLLNKMYEEIFKGKFANKVERLKIEKEMMSDSNAKRPLEL